MAKTTSKGRSNFFNGLLIAVLGFLAIQAIREQLARPEEERTWHGTIYGVPYDFRLPDVERLQNTFWNKNTDQILVPQAFGIGWTINLYPLIHPRETLNITE